MSELKLCQGPGCHKYKTKDRLKGQTDNKTFQTRRRSSMYYGSGNFCSSLNSFISNSLSFISAYRNKAKPKTIKPQPTNKIKL